MLADTHLNVVENSFVDASAQTEPGATKSPNTLPTIPCRRTFLQRADMLPDAHLNAAKHSFVDASAQTEPGTAKTPNILQTFPCCHSFLQRYHNMPDARVHIAEHSFVNASAQTEPLYMNIQLAVHGANMVFVSASFAK